MGNSISSERYLYVRLYNNDGKVSPAFKIENNLDQLASIIVKTADCPRIVITDSGDNLLLDTINGYVDYIWNKDFLKNNLLRVLIPMQKSKIKPCPIEVIDWGVAEEFNYREIMSEFIKKNFGVEM